MSDLLASLGLGQQTPASVLDAPVDDFEPAPLPPAGYKRLSTAETARIVRLAAEDVPVLQIAELTGRHHATIYDCLERFAPTVELAKQRLDSMALTAADTLHSTMQKGVNDRVRMESATKVLETVGLAPTGDSKGHKIQVAVVIGGPLTAPTE